MSELVIDFQSITRKKRSEIFLRRINLRILRRIAVSFASLYKAIFGSVSLDTDSGHAVKALFMSEAQNAGAAGTSASMERAGSILDEYGNAILRLAYSYLHNMSDSEDIVQDTLIQYIKASPSFEGQEHEKAWLLRVAANLSKNRIKYNKLRETDELMDELVAEKSEDLTFVWEAVKELPEKYREVIHLFYEEGLSTREIAKVLDRKEATVRSDLLRGREKLKTILKEAYDFE